ncbi:MAG: sulfatase-like hydrolase/transferase [Planctomycetota bacterium]
MASKNLRTRLGLVVLVLALALVVAAWVFWPPGPTPNVLFITLDTTRADRLGCYGYSAALTPTLDQLASEGVLFERAYSPAPLTLPVHASLFTGLYPPEHGLRTNGRGKLDPSLPTLAQLLAERGYDTGAFVASFVLDAKFGLKSGFSTYDDDLSSAEPTEDSLHRQRDGAVVVDAALRWLGKPRTKPFLCWVHLYDPHLPYQSREEEFGDRFRDSPYDAEIAYADRQIARLLDHLRTTGQEKHTVVVVVGDHGEGLGEHIELSHGYTLYNSTQHVPLICRFPGRFVAGKREKTPVSLVDLHPTLCGVLGINIPTSTLGRNLGSSLQGGQLTASSCYAGTDDPFLQNGWSPQRSLTTERWKYVRSTIPELYDLIADPQEANNLASTDEEQMALMDQMLVDFESRMETRVAADVQLNPRERRALKSLGYLGGGSGTANLPTGAELPDVKQMLAYDAAVQAAIDLLHAGRVPEARTKLQEIVDATPNHVASRVFLGETYAHQGDQAAAVAWYQAALKIQPDNPDALVHLGTAFVAQDRIVDAIAKFEEVLRIDEESTAARYNLGLALAREGQVEDATVHFEKLLQIDDHFPDARVALASALLAQGRAEEAIVRLEQEVAINRRSVSARLNLATLLAEQNPSRAYNLLLDALQIDPHSGQAHYNLGAFLLLHQKPAEAIAPLVEAVRIMPESTRAASELERAKRLAGQLK